MRADSAWPAVERISPEPSGLWMRTGLLALREDGLMTRTPEQIMRTYLLDVVVSGRLDLIDELARPDMVDEANQAFGGPPGRAGLVAHVVGFRRNVGNLDLVVDRVVAGTGEVMACGPSPQP